MPRLLSFLAVAAAFIPAVFANETDCNISRVDILSPTDRNVQYASIGTDYEVTRYDFDVTSTPESNVILHAYQNSDSGASFSVSLNGSPIDAVGDVNNPTIAMSNFVTTCDHDNVVLIEVTEVKSLDKRMDSCRFKYELNLHNPHCSA